MSRGGGWPRVRAVHDVRPLVSLLSRPIVALDVGCRWGVTDGWGALLPDALRVYAFDADPDECARLQAAAPEGVAYVPLALGDRSREATLYLTAAPGCSSLFPPAEPLRERTPALREELRVVAREPLRLETLDRWAADEGVVRVDVMKLDVQGAEGLVLEGAATVLQDVRVIESEVVFNPLYEGQALFGDVDRLLRNHGFELWSLRQLVHYSADWRTGDAPVDDVQITDSRPTGFRAEGGQLSWGHAYYVAPEYLSGDWSSPAEAARDAVAASLLGLDELARHAATKAGVALDAAQDEDALVEVAEDEVAETAPVAVGGEPATADGAELLLELDRVRADRDALHAELHRVRADRDRLQAGAARGGTVERVRSRLRRS